MALTDSENAKKLEAQRSCSENVPELLLESRNHTEEDDDECELTNLNWLTELKNVGYIQLQENPVDVPLTRFNKFLDELKVGQEKYKRDHQFYKENGEEKPPFNYAHLIGISLMENGRMTLQQVYDWIQDNFLYYRSCGTNWQSSIRHNLSLGFFFKNTARGDNERGKGGYWELALDSRKTEWKRNRKSRKNRHQLNNNNNNDNDSNSPTISERRSSKSPLKSINRLERKNKRPSKRHRFSGASPPGKRRRIQDENEEDEDVIEEEEDEEEVEEEELILEELEMEPSHQTEIILTVEAQSTEEYFHDRISEDTHVEFVHDFNLNNQIFQASEVPQPIDDVEVPFFHVATTTATTTLVSQQSSSAATQSPNVIVETLPYNLPPLEEYNFGTAFNEQKIFEDLLEYENELM